MSQGRLIVACDFGTLSFRSLVTEFGQDGRLEVVGCAEEKAEGWQDGDFVDLVAGSPCISRLMRKLEVDSDIYISGFIHNISGSHLHSVRATAQVAIGPGPRPIRESDIDAANNQARGMAIPFDHKVLTVNPVEYAVDRVRGIVDPRGRVGSQLEIQAHLITGSRNVLHNVENAIETAKFTPLGQAVDILATGGALLKPEDREKGVMLIDVGGLTTQWAVYARGSILANGSVAWGGHNLTSDLAHGLRISLEEAEKVKLSRGVVLRSLVAGGSVDGLFDQECPEETPGLVAAILEPRLEEILALVKSDFGDLRELSELGAGIVLTGGGSLCRGTRQLCEEIFDLAATKRYLPPDLRRQDRLLPGQWATALGLSLWAASEFADQPQGMPSQGSSRCRSWLRNLWRRPRPDGAQSG